MSCLYIPHISVIDFMISMFLIVIFLVAATTKNRNFGDEKPEYEYYVGGLIFKFFCVIGFLIIFIFYYGGGDTVDYHEGALAMRNLFYKSPAEYFDLLFNNITWEKYVNYFDSDTCYPPTSLIKKNSNFTVIRIASFIQLFLPDAILATNIIIARIAYGAIFKLYSMFCEFFPGREKALAYTFLFMPSVAFWGSGIMKDTVALSAICWIVVLFNDVLIKKISISIPKIAGLILAIFALYLIKTYLLLALAPGLIIWFNFQRIQRIKSRFIQIFVFPVIFGASFLGIISFYSSNSELFGAYGANSVLDEAAKVQQDLLREESYGSNSFNIGTFEPTVAGITAKVPAALTAGLFRPFILESGGSPTMVLAGLENLVLLGLFLYALIKTKVVGFFTNIFNHPLLILGFVFTLLLAFSIGLTSANFGAMVRYKVPLVPFFMSIILLGIHKNKTEV